MSPRDDVRNHVREHRRRLEITQQELGDRVGVTRQTIVAIEKGNLIVAPTQLRCHDLYTFHHSVNVFLVSTALLQPFAKDAEELAVFAQAALLHDVGKTRIPYEILHKRGRLTEEEYRAALDAAREVGIRRLDA